MAIISNSIQNNTNNGGQTPVSRARTFRSGSSAIQLQEGQTLKGVVSDVHGNQITLSMEDGASFTGKLPDANQYSIGQKAAFQITSLDNNTIYMKAISGAYLLDMEDTVDQALEEAGLPKSDRNIDVVRSLLKNQQSISRENIMANIRLCAQYADADVDSVITLKRLNLPMTQETVKQFSNYQNQTHQLLYKMESLTDSLTDMMNSIGHRVPRLAKNVANELINLALDSALSPAEQKLTALSPDIVNEEFTDETGEVLSAEETENMANAATEAEEQLTGTGEASSPLSRMRQLFSNISESVSSSLSGEAAVISEETFFIHEQIGFSLSEEGRENLSRLLADYPISDELKKGILDGTATIRDVLTELRSYFPGMEDDEVSHLLTNKEFQSLIKNQFVNNWTVSPEQLKEKGSMEELYQKMSQQLEQISTFSERVLGKDVFSQVSGNAADMNSNLDFMKMMNETFQYIQLPLKLQNQNAHGDLYVMTRKEALKKDPNKLKVLLHLDMDHLGTLDIQISKENTAVSANFFVSSDQTKNLLEKNIELLSDAINEQGYAFSSELALKEKDVDVVNDFIGADAPVGNITRYNFDLRA